MWNKEVPKMVRVPVDSDAINSSFVLFQLKQNKKSKQKKIKFRLAMLSSKRNISVECNV